MDALQTSSCESDPIQVLTSKECEPIKFTNESHSVRILQKLQSLRKNDVLCDIRFETDDGAVLSGHKNILIAASPYFRAMFSNFDESNKDLVKIRKLDSTILQLLIDYIYTGKIKVSEKNVQGLLPAANILQLDFINAACADFLQNQLDATNCIGIKAFADLHNCKELLRSSETYIIKHYTNVVEGEEFVSLSFEDLLKIISSNHLVAFEKHVFESVVKWIRHDLEQRRDFLPELMKHVRFPILSSTPDTFHNLVKEVRRHDSPACKNVVSEALNLNPHISVQNCTNAQTIRFKPRLFDVSRNVILIFTRSKILPKFSTQCYDPITQLLQDTPAEMNDCRVTAGFGVIKDKFVFVMGGVNQTSSKSVSMLDISLRSPSWVPMVDMLVSRFGLGVGALDNCIYAVGGHDGFSVLNSVEVFDSGIKKWQMVSSMSVARLNTGVCVLDNRLYAVGGYNGVSCLKSVECYDPSLDSWTPIADMSTPRDGVGVGVLGGVIYAIGGYNGSEFLKSAEIYIPSDGVWYTIKNMLFPRNKPGVVALNGLLYVIGGEVENSAVDIVQIYNPYTNTWFLELLSKNGSKKCFYCVSVDKPPNFITN